MRRAPVRAVVSALGVGALLAFWLAAHRLAGQAPPASALLDLHSAVVVTSLRATPRERKAVQVLVEEVHRRTLITLPVQTTWPAAGRAVISVGRIGTLPGADSFRAERNK